MFKNIFQNIKVLAQINPMSSRTTSSATNYGDYVKFLELVGNCKVSIEFRQKSLTSKKKEKEKENLFFSWS